VNGAELREYLADGTPHSYIDLVCANCYNIIATISIGPSDGGPPAQLPLRLEETAPRDEELEGPLRRVQQVDLRREGERIQARLAELVGTGDKLPEALRSLASSIEQSELTIWVPSAARTFMDDGQLKAECPECGHVTTFGDYSKVIAYVCEGCGLGVDVEE
jgi:ribosomal protein S27E